LAARILSPKNEINLIQDLLKKCAEGSLDSINLTRKVFKVLILQKKMLIFQDYSNLEVDSEDKI
jgi:hypothetical protein